MAEPIEGKIAKIIDDRTIILNVGARDGTKEGMIFVIYDPGDEVTDPDTGVSLGKWEMVKGRVVVSHVQERISTATPPPKPTSGDSGTLSAMMVEHSRGVYSSQDKNRYEPLPVRTSDISGKPSLSPIAVGDRVRSVERTS